MLIVIELDPMKESNLKVVTNGKKFVATFKGVPADKLSREELIVAFTWAVKELQQERKLHLESLEMERLFAKSSIPQ